MAEAFSPGYHSPPVIPRAISPEAPFAPDPMEGPLTEFGRAGIERWALDPSVTYLNHGTVGATPKRVIEAQRRICDEIERRPSQFLLRELSSIGVFAVPPEKPRIRAAADAVAEFVGARGADFVFADNVTTAINAVLRSFELHEGDEVLLTDHTYGAIVNATTFVTRERGAGLRIVELPYPGRAPGITPQNLAEAVVDAIAGAIGPRTRLAIVDHVTSLSALVLPLREIAARCREKGVPVLVDGAHAPGAIPLDVPAVGVDWYAANLHKWAWSPRSCGFLWAPPERQRGLHPPVISWGLDQGFTDEFDLVGTRDPSACLAAPEAIAFMRELGVEAVRGYNHALAWEAARYLADRWGTTLGMPEAMVGSMATVPLPEGAGATNEDAARLRDALLFEDRIEVQLHDWRGRLWVRVSAQIYNEMADVERLAAATLARL